MWVTIESHDPQSLVSWLSGERRTKAPNKEAKTLVLLWLIFIVTDLEHDLELVFVVNFCMGIGRQHWFCIYFRRPSWVKGRICRHNLEDPRLGYRVGRGYYVKQTRNTGRSQTCNYRNLGQSSPRQCRDETTAGWVNGHNRSVTQTKHASRQCAVQWADDTTKIYYGWSYVSDDRHLTHQGLSS